jgi:histidinol-phosphate aminotransferase
MEIENLLRENIRRFKPYSSARDEYSGKEGIFLDANENSFGSVSKVTANRYPDPYQFDLKNKIAKLKKVPPEHIFLGNGSDEAIDLLFRAFCRPGIDKCLLMPPTYGMYGVCAELNDVQVIQVPLTENFEIDTAQVLDFLTKETKLIFICSPNNPSANQMSRSAIRTILENTPGLVILDEAYIDFSDDPGWLADLDNYKNLVILQTFSKAWGMAGLRLGMAFAHTDIIQVLNKIKYPYNISILTQQIAADAVDRVEKKERYVDEIIAQRKILLEHLQSLSIVKKIFPSDANFILVKFKNARPLYNKLLAKGIIVRDRSRMVHCQNCLRITIGTAEENKTLIEILQRLSVV